MSRPTPKLIRTTSGIISNQENDPICWNYASCAMFVRLVCNVLNIPEDNTCDDMYEYIKDFDATYAKKKCSDNSYKKICLYVFFFRLGMLIFSCGRTGIGNTSNKFMDILKEPRTEIIEKLYEDEDEDEDESDNKRRIIQIAMILVREFRKKIKEYRVKMPLLIPSNFRVTRQTSEITRNLDKGLYVLLSINIGKGKYSEEFNEYKTNMKKPFAKYINHGATDYDGHAMVITGYSKIYKSKDIAFHVRNSWGKQWGNNGYIDILSSELPILNASFLAFEGISSEILTQTIAKTTIKKPELNVIDESDDPAIYERSLYEHALGVKLMDVFEVDTIDVPIEREQFDIVLMELLPYEEGDSSVPDEILTFIHKYNNHPGDNLQEPITVKDIVIASRFASDENDESISFQMMLPYIDKATLRKVKTPRSASKSTKVKKSPTVASTLKSRPPLSRYSNKTKRNNQDKSHKSDSE